MTPCVGSKIVKAKPMEKAEFKNTIKGEGDMMSAQENQDGYLVEYPDRYQGWNEKTEFERCSRKMTDDELSFVGQTVIPGYSISDWEFYVTTKILGLQKDELITLDEKEGKSKEDGYNVLYSNGHQSWTPKIKTDEVYRKINEQELTLIEKGAKWDFDPWHYVENGDLPEKSCEIFALLNILQDGYYSCVLIYDKPNDMMYLKENEHYSYKSSDVKCWMYNPEPKY